MHPTALDAFRAAPIRSVLNVGSRPLLYDVGQLVREQLAPGERVGADIDSLGTRYRYRA
jgi:hypothetical protein